MESEDMAPAIEPKSDQLNADDLIGGPITVTITGAKVSPNEAQQKCTINFEGDNGRPYKPGKSMSRVMVAAWGKKSAQYVGKSMTLYCDPNVQFGGAKVGGIRISHMSHIENDMNIALTVTRGKKAPFHVKRLAEQQQHPDPIAIAQAIQKATDAAASGTEAFTAWFNSPEGKEVRHLFKDDQAEMAKIKGICAEADADDVDNGGGVL